MPKIKWKEFLEGTTQLSPSAERKMRHDIRKKARQCIENLIFILESIHKVSSKPERDFAKILKDDQYFRLVKTLGWAWRESYNHTVKLSNKENWKILRIAAMEAGLPVVSGKKDYDAGYRLDTMRRLKRKEKEDGVPYLEHVQRQILYSKEMRFYGKQRKRLAVCPQCGLEQESLNYIICSKCKFKGPVVGDLFNP